jgi:hypothetical protein
MKEVRNGWEAFGAATQMYLAGRSYAPPCSEHAGRSLAIGRLERCFRYLKAINDQIDVAKALVWSDSAQTSKAPVVFDDVWLKV